MHAKQQLQCWDAKMGAAFLPPPLLHGRSFSESKLPHTLIRRHNHQAAGRIKAAVNDVVSGSVTFDPSQPQLTWQIVVGTIAGVTPFVVAGIEFSKRIAAQRKCSVCRGSGLVLRDNKYYFRCPRCGGFLPWQSWKRFFSG